MGMLRSSGVGDAWLCFKALAASLSHFISYGWVLLSSTQLGKAAFIKAALPCRGCMGMLRSSGVGKKHVILSLMGCTPVPYNGL
jgi:hypothetical protein